MARYGYARVSTDDQHPEIQEDRLTAAGCDRIFTDKISGTRSSRPEWDKLLALLAPGDELVCVRLDRIGRSARHLHNLFGELKNRQVGLVCVDQGIDTTRGKGWDEPMSQLLIGVLAILAEFERSLIIERTLDGQAAVRRRGNLRRSLGGLPPLGFRDDGGDDWQADPGQAAWLADAAERVLAGEPVEAVHAALPPMRDSTGRPVSAKMLRAALQRPASAGLIADNGGYLPAATGGPLEETTWRRLRVLFAARKTGRRIDGDRYPLGPLLRCAKCGNQLTGELVRARRPTGKAWAEPEPRGYYACANPHKHLPWGGSVTRPCKGVSVLADDVHALMRGVVIVWAKTPAARLAAARTPADSPDIADHRAELTTRIAETQGWLADLTGKRNRRLMSPVRFAELEADLIAQIEADAAELAELDRIGAEPGVPFVFEWDELTAGEKRAVLAEAVVTPIDVQPGNGGTHARSLSAADRISLIAR